jgi:hypothetical protein
VPRDGITLGKLRSGKQKSKKQKKQKAKLQGEVKVFPILLFNPSILNHYS